MPPIKKPKRRRQDHFLKAWRVRRKAGDPKFTQAYMAERIGVDRTTYGRIENGKIPYSQDHLELAAGALGCHPADILSHAPGDTESPWPYWLRMSPGNRQVALNVIIGLAAGRAA